jgi:hypothetical protein
MLIYSPHITPRLVYITHWIFGEVYRVPFRLTGDWGIFEKETGARLNYSNQPLPGVLQILPHGLLSELEIKKQPVGFIQKEGTRYPFTVGDDLLGFDIFAAAFYFLSRYEEYLPHQQDEFGRFPAKASLQYEMGCLYQPVVDNWLAMLKEKILLPEPATARSYQPLFTYDIDTAFAYTGRSFGVTAGHLMKDLFTGRFKAFFLRLKVLSGKTADPSDTYDEIIAQNKRYELQPIFFLLMGERNKYNRNLPYNHPQQKQLVQQLSKTAVTGLHPSYHTDTDAALLQEEKKRLETITGQRVTKSRQHYLRLAFPQTYQQLVATGITEDYSMGFAETPGFRAGTCTPFYFFDLLKNETSILRVFPVTFMEGSFAEDMRMAPETAYPIMLQLLNAVKEVNGMLCCIWHNHTLGDTGRWKGWKEVHHRILQAACSI